MIQPYNFDSVKLDGLIAGWFDALLASGVVAIVVLGPVVVPPSSRHETLVVHPPKAYSAAQLLAATEPSRGVEIGADESLISWHALDASEPRTTSTRSWANAWLNHGAKGMLRMVFPLVAGRSFECYLFTRSSALTTVDQARLSWSSLSMWPKIKRELVACQSSLTLREVECLRLAFDGLTAHETADVLGCGDRTVNFHLTNAMAKLDAHNKLEAIKKACWLGVL